MTNRLVLNLSSSANIRDNLESRSKSQGSTGGHPVIFATDSILGNFGGVVGAIHDSTDFEEDEGNYGEEMREYVDNVRGDIDRARTGFAGFDLPDVTVGDLETAKVAYKEQHDSGVASV